MRNTTIAVLVLGTLLACAGSATAQAPTAPGDADKATPSSKPALCKHDSPKSECFICDPTLRDKGRLWCKEHERYEDRCWICHPEAQDKTRPFCKEHSLYEDECFLCHPQLKKKQGGNAPSAPKEGSSK